MPRGGCIYDKCYTAEGGRENCKFQQTQASKIDGRELGEACVSDMILEYILININVPSIEERSN